MTLHIISNPDRPERVKMMMQELERQKITDYRFWPSVHIANKPKRCGISKAHKQIVEWALIEQLPEVCICEDDIWFPAEDGWQYFLNNKPKEFYDLYLGGIYRGEIDEKKMTKRFTGMICYVVSEAFYDRFLAVDENVDIDGGMSGRGRFHVCYPFACICKPCWSDNQMGYIDYNHLLKGREVHGVGVM